MLKFLGAFLRDPVAIGAVAPSGPQLAALEVGAADLRPGARVVELGAGTGPMTAVILERHPDVHLLVLEPDPSLAAALRARFPKADIVEAVAQRLPELIAERGWTSVDRVVSGLPWAIWPEALQREVFDAIEAVLAPGGRFVTFAYLHAQMLPAAGRLRETLRRRFSRVDRTNVAWRNLPPAFVFVCDARD